MQNTSETTLLEQQVTNWAPMRKLHGEFIKLHPELGLRHTESTYKSFCLAYGKDLIERGVVRRVAGLRGPLIADVENFERAVFDLLTSSEVPA